MDNAHSWNPIHIFHEGNYITSTININVLKITVTGVAVRRVGSDSSLNDKEFLRARGLSDYIGSQCGIYGNGMVNGCVNRRVRR